MLQFIMDRNVLLYVLAAACAVGVVSQMILKQVYERLLRDTKNTGEPAGRFLVQLRQRFQYCSHLNEKVGDVQALIRRSLMDYRFWGMGLHQWKRIGIGCLSVSLLCSFAGVMMLVQNGSAIVAGNTYFWMGALSIVLTAAAYGISDTGYQREALEVGLADYLQNSGAVRSFGESEEEEIYNAGYDQKFEPEYEQKYSQEFGQEYEAAGENSASVVSVAGGRKARRRIRQETAAASENRAQREKRELKENLSRLKAGMQETAASGEKERGSELLRQMDPKDQERIVKEVLREFLS